MHKHDGDLITYRGHSLTADEFHSVVLGCIGLLFGLPSAASDTIANEPWYFLGGFIASYLVGRKVDVF